MMNKQHKQEIYKLVEVWQRDEEDHNLWHGPKGVLVNTEALEERKVYFDLVLVS